MFVSSLLIFLILPAVWLACFIFASAQLLVDLEGVSGSQRHLRWGLDTHRAALRTHPGRYVHLPPLMRTSKSTLDLEVNHAVACVRIA